MLSNIEKSKNMQTKTLDRHMKLLTVGRNESGFKTDYSDAVVYTAYLTNLIYHPMNFLVMQCTRLIPSSLISNKSQSIRTINVAMGPLRSRQKIAFKTRYHWMLDLKKSKARAKYPWIPREPTTSMEIYGQKIIFPEMYLDFIVPNNLDKCELKPYVSWQSKLIEEGPLTAEVLFNNRYSQKITEMFKNGASNEEIMEYLKNTNC